MKLTPICAILSVLLCSQPSFASDSDGFNSIYKAYTQAQKSGDKDQTLALAQKAVELGKIKFATDSESLTNLKYNLAYALTDAQQVELAEDIHQEIRKAYKQQFGEVSQPYFHASLELLALYAENGWPAKKVEMRTKRASKLVNQIISITKKLEIANRSQSARNYYLAAKTIFNNPGIKGNYKSVVRYITTARDKVLKQFGENDLKTIETRYLVGRLNMRPGRYSDAVENLETIVSTVESQLDTSHPYEMASHAALIEAYEKLGKSDEATKHCVAIGRMTPWQDDVEPTPLYRVNPKYPASYARSGKEGYTTMSFDISASGFVNNVKVIDSSGELFTKEAIAALDKWRYAPKFKNGQAVAATGLEVQLNYRLAPN